jgi:hypothetical protein
MHAGWKIPRSPRKEERKSLDCSTAYQQTDKNIDRQMRTKTDTENRMWKDR